MEKVFRNTTYLIAGGSIGELVMFFLFIGISGSFGEAAIGKYVFAMAVTAFLINLVSGPRDLVVREIARDTKVGARFLSGLIVVQIGLAIVALGLLSAWDWLLPFDRETFTLVVILFVYQFSFVVGRSLLSQADGREEMGWPAILGLFLKVTISLTGLSLLWLGQPLVVVVSAYAISGVVYLLVAALVVTGRYGLPRFPGWKYVMHVLWVGLPFALEPLVFVVYGRADIVMLSYFLGDRAAGIYAFPYRVLEMSGVCFSLYGTALYPVFARLYQSDRQELARIFRTSRMVVFVLASLAMLTILLGSGMGIRILFQDKFAESIVVFKVMSCFALTNSLRYLYFPLLLAANGQRYCLIVGVIVTVLNVGMNAVMIPLWGVMGAVMATLCSEIVYLVVYDLAASKILENSVNVPGMVMAAMVLAIPVAIGLGVLQWFAAGPAILSAWIIFLGLIFVTGMVEFRRVNELLGLLRVYPR